MHGSRTSPLTMLLLAGSLCAFPAGAQTVRPEPGTGTAPETRLALPLDTTRPFSIQLSGQGEHTFRADMDGPGNVSLTRAVASVGFSARLREGIGLRLQLDGEWSQYDFENATTIIAGTGEPWSDVQSYRLAPTFTFDVGETWSLLVGGDVRIAYEPGADLGDSLTGGGFIAARWKIDENFALTLGVSGRSRIEDDALVLPVLGVEWKISDRLSFATQGIGGGLTYKLTDALDLTLRASYDPRDYRLDDDRALLPGGVVQDDRVPVGLELTWRPSPMIALSVYGGAVVYQEFETLDSVGNTVSEVESDPAAFIAVRGTIRF